MGQGFARGLGAPMGRHVQSLALKLCPKSGSQNEPGAPRRVCYSLSGGRGGASSPGLGMRQGSARGLRVSVGRLVQSPTQKIVPAGRGAKTPHGTRDGCAIALLAARGCGLRRTRNEVRLCERPRGTHGEAHLEPRLKIVSVGWGAKMHQGPRDRCAIALREGAGVRPPLDSEWGKAFRGASGHPWGGAFKGSSENSARRSGHKKASCIPR